MQEHRLFACSLLSGCGLEIGALHQPAWLPDGASVVYADAQSAAQARQSFPELREADLVEVDHIVDLDREGLSAFADESLDFVIFSHVIEHVANPIRVLRDICRTLRPSGCLVIAAPDKHYTFDKPRPSTSLQHLRDEFATNIDCVDDDHYVEFLRHVHPEIKEGTAHWSAALAQVRDRREHAHVWTSVEFQAFLRDAFEFLQVQARPVVEFHGAETDGEYFSAWMVKELATLQDIQSPGAQFGKGLTHLRTVLQQRSEIPALRSALEHFQGATQNLNSALSEMRSHRDRVQTELKMAEVRITEFETQLLAERERFQAVRESAARLMTEREKVWGEVARSKDATIAALLASRSWRFTAPLRRLASKTRK